LREIHAKGEWAMGIFSDIEGANKLSPSRKISYVAPPKKKTVAFCFTESPCALGGVTEEILSSLSEYGAKATFIVYGSTDAGTCAKISFGKRPRLPSEGNESLGGARSCGELIRKISASGCEIAGSGYSYIPIGAHRKSLFSAVASYKTALDFYTDNLKLVELLTGITGAPVKLMAPPFEALKSKDERSVYDVYNALFCSHISYSRDYGRAYIEDGDEETESDRLIKSVSVNLAAAENYYNGKILRFCGGIGGFRGSPTVKALPVILNMLTDRG